MSEDGYNFLGWYIGVNKVEPGTITVTGAGITLTAQWEVIQCKITYTTDLSSAPAPRTVNWGTLLNSEQLPELSCTGWTFKGWLFNGEPVSENYKVTGSITLTADWEKMKCRIIYESAHGSYVPEEAVLEYGSRLPSSMLPELSDNEGKWEFKGWYLKNAVNGEPLEGGTYTVEGHVTLTAKWECKTASTGMNVELISSNELYVYWNQNWSEDRHCYVYEFIGEDNYSSYKWLIDGNTKSGWNSNTVVLYGDEYARGMYTIMAVATDSDGNRRSYTAQVTIN